MIFFDFSIYVDARTEDIERWYVNRFLTLRSSAFANPESYFKRYAELSDEQAVEVATGIWKSVNEPNLVQNVFADSCSCAFDSAEGCRAYRGAGSSA